MGKKKPIVLTRAVETKLYDKFLVLTLAYFMELGAFAQMDENGMPIFTTNEDGERRYVSDANKLASAYRDLNKWLEAVNNHMITIQQVRKIIKERINEKVE